jgi:hypothetical protein
VTPSRTPEAVLVLNQMLTAMLWVALPAGSTRPVPPMLAQELCWPGVVHQYPSSAMNELVPLNPVAVTPGTGPATRVGLPGRDDVRAGVAGGYDDTALPLDERVEHRPGVGGAGVGQVADHDVGRQRRGLHRRPHLCRGRAGRDPARPGEQARRDVQITAGLRSRGRRPDGPGRDRGGGHDDAHGQPHPHAPGLHQHRSDTPLRRPLPSAATLRRRLRTACGTGVEGCGTSVEASWSARHAGGLRACWYRGPAGGMP